MHSLLWIQLKNVTVWNFFNCLRVHLMIWIFLLRKLNCVVLCSVTCVARDTCKINTFEIGIWYCYSELPLSFCRPSRITEHTSLWKQFKKEGMAFCITCNDRQKTMKICRQQFISRSTLKEFIFISFLTLPIRTLKTVWQLLFARIF